MREIEQVSDRIIFLSRGKVVADDSPNNLKAYFGQDDLEEIFISINREPVGEP
jgi:ABC-2 type transport system ATP-binding protein